MGQPMQETLYNRQWMKKSLYQTADARDSLSDSRCKRLYIRQQMQQSLYQTADAGVSKLDPEVYRADLYTLSRA